MSDVDLELIYPIGRHVIIVKDGFNTDTVYEITDHVFHTLTNQAKALELVDLRTLHTVYIQDPDVWTVQLMPEIKAEQVWSDRLDGRDRLEIVCNVHNYKHRFTCKLNGKVVMKYRHDIYADYTLIKDIVAEIKQIEFDREKPDPNLDIEHAWKAVKELCNT